MELKLSPPLAQCHHELGLVVGEASHFAQSEALLLSLKDMLHGQKGGIRPAVSTNGRDESHRFLTSSCQDVLLLHLEILKDAQASKDELMAVWNEYAQLADVEAADISRVTHLVADSESKRLEDGLYAPEVIGLVIRAALRQRANDIQRMVGKLLLTLVGALHDMESVQLARDLFHGA